MQFSAAQIAAIIKAKVEGDASATVASFGKIEEAKPGQLAFLANPKYEDHLYTTGATIIIINEALELRQPINATLLRVPDAYSAFATLLDTYQQLRTQQLTGVQEFVHIEKSVKLGNNVFVGSFSYLAENVKVDDDVKILPGCIIGTGVSIGAGTILHPGVKILRECVIGKNVTIHAGTVIGSDGFGFAPQADGTFKKVPQIGNVIIEDNVEIGANATIDRATIGSTIIRAGAKLDNLIQVAHNVEVGNNSVIAAQAGVSGSTKIGNNVMIGGQAGIVGHIQIADGTKINAQSGVSKSIKTPHSVVTGSPAHDYSAALRSQALNRKLPELEKRLSELERLIKSIKADQENM